MKWYEIAQYAARGFVLLIVELIFLGVIQLTYRIW